MVEQQELPGVPEPPEAPEIVVYLRYAAHWLFGDPALLRQNWKAISIAALIVAVGFRFADKWIYEEKINSMEGAEITTGATIENQKSTIQAQANTIVQLQEELKGTSPQLAAIQANRDKIRTKLHDYYVESGNFLNDKMSSKVDALAMSDKDSKWARDLAAWSSTNMGEAAAARIFDPETAPSLLWSQCSSAECNSLRNWLLGIRRNLSTLIETAAWDGTPTESKHP